MIIRAFAASRALEIRRAASLPQTILLLSKAAVKRTTAVAVVPFFARGAALTTHVVSQIAPHRGAGRARCGAGCANRQREEAFVQGRAGGAVALCGGAHALQKPAQRAQVALGAFCAVCVAPRRALIAPRCALASSVGALFAFTARPLPARTREAARAIGAPHRALRAAGGGARRAGRARGAARGNRKPPRHARRALRAQRRANHGGAAPRGAQQALGGPRLLRVGARGAGDLVGGALRTEEAWRAIKAEEGIGCHRVAACGTRLANTNARDVGARVAHCGPRGRRGGRKRRRF